LIGIVGMTVLLALGLMFSVVLLAVAFVVGLGAFGYFWWRTRTLRAAMKSHAASAGTDGQVFEGEAVIVEEWRTRQSPALSSEVSSATTPQDAERKA
jgi:hypothetical protein